MTLKGVLNSAIALSNKRWVLPLAILIAVSFRVSYEVQFNDFSIDKSFQVFAAKEIDNGNGCVVRYANTEDLSSPNFHSLLGYTQAYSYLISVFTPYFSYSSATFIIDSIMIVLLLYSIIAILKLLDISRARRSLYLLLLAILVSPFNILSSTDLIVTSLVMLNVLAVLTLYLKQSDSFKSIGTNILLISILSFLPLLFKISAFPWTFLGLIGLIIIAIIKRRKIYATAGLISLILSGLFSYISFYFLPYFPKSKFTERGFFPEHLLSIDPFPIKALWDIDSYLNALINPTIIQVTFVIASILLLGVIVILIKQWKGKNEFQMLSIFLGLTTASTVLIVGFLSLLSVSTPNEIVLGSHWTFLEETRYYGPVMIMIQLAVFIIAVNQKVRQRVRLFFKSVLISMFIINGLFFFKQNLNLLDGNGSKYTYNWNYTEELQICDVINSEGEINSIIIYASTVSNNPAFVVANSKVNSLLFSSLEVSSELNSSGPVNLFLNCDQKSFEKINDLHNFEDYSLLLALNKSNLYKIRINCK